MKQFHIRRGTIFQILRFLYRIAKRWGIGGMPTQVKRAIPSPALLPAATGSHPSGHLLRERPDSRLQQLRQNAVLHDESGGGEGKGAAIEGGIAGLHTVLHKGELGGGKLLPVAGLIGGKIQPLAQPQL